MLSSHRNKIVAVIAALVVVVGAGAAVGATGALSPKAESDAVLDDAAEQLGVEPGELSAALKTALKNRVDEAVADGRLTEAQGQAMKERIDAGDVPLLGLGPGLHFHHGPPGVFGGPDAAADYLGMTQAQLREALEDGKSLAEVAKSKGKSVDGLVSALVADAKERLDNAVEDGRLTEAQSKEMLADLEKHITAMVNSELPPKPALRVEPGFDELPESTGIVVPA
jgi:polyhydroxyalkanoate synthesis regulator phasin